MPTWATSASDRSGSPGSSIVMPALILNYFGQGALLLSNPEAVRNPFLQDGPGLGAAAAGGASPRWPR
jgi:hypothetical protein